MDYIKNHEDKIAQVSKKLQFGIIAESVLIPVTICFICLQYITKEKLS